MNHKQTRLKSLLPAVLLGAITSSSALAYELIDLGANVEPKAINNFGVVVGASNTDQYPATAFSWSSGSGFDLINGGTSANAVNDAGQVAGSTVDGAFILDGNYRDWSDFGAFGINQLGEVAGYNVGTNPYQPRSLPYNPAIFIGNNWEVFDIAKLYSRGTRKGVYADRFILNSINDGGYSVGYKYRYGLAGSSAILIDTNRPVKSASDVVYLSTYGGRAVDINESNMIAGTTANNTTVTPVIYSRAFVYDYNATVDNLTVLPVLDGGLHSHAYDINENDVVAGYSESAAGTHAVLWNETGGIEDLNNLIPVGTGWVLTSATAINDNGDFTGIGTLNGVAHGFVLTNGTITQPPPAQNQPPVAVVSADVILVKTRELVTFDSSGSTDDGTITGYSWDFMDGKFSTDANPSHKFTKAGIYGVTLTVTDDGGTTASDSITIDVTKK